MHDRNVFSRPRDFGALADKYDFFAPFVLPTKGSQKTIDFQDTSALRALARVLLLDQFGLKVEFPIGTLVPRVPHRLEYILFIEDFIQEYDFMQDDDITGIDIGTGASAIYSLLGAKTNQWKMIATEINQLACESAINNVQRNGLSDLIRIERVAPGSMFADIASILKSKKHTFVMCNPPFFDDEELKVMGHRRSETCPGPSGGPTGNVHELGSGGGEVELVTKMIRESVEYSKDIMLFTTMIGVVRHLKQIKETFQQLQISNFLVREAVCGKTCRWYIAWSFDERILLHPGNAYIVNRLEHFPRWMNLETLIIQFLNQINIKETRVKKRSGDCLHIVAYETTWRQQRKRKRANRAVSSSTEAIPQKVAKNESSSSPNNEHTSSEILPINPVKIQNEETPVHSSISKTGLVAMVEQVDADSTSISPAPDCKEDGSVVSSPSDVFKSPQVSNNGASEEFKVKFSGENEAACANQTDQKIPKLPLLDIIITVIQESKGPSTIYLTFRGGLLGRQGLQELNQYLINCYTGKVKTLYSKLAPGEQLSHCMLTYTYR